jgi:hypothetical protein
MPLLTRKRALFYSTESESVEVVVSMGVSWPRRAYRKMVKKMINNV